MIDGLDALAFTGFLAAAVRVATPLLLAALGETVTERGGVINLGIEGAMLAGALASAMVAASGGPWQGLATAMLLGAMVALVLGGIVVAAGVNQIIAGTAVTLACVGLTGAVHRQWVASGTAVSVVPTLAPVPIPLLADLPIVGPALFRQPPPTYIAMALVPLIAWALFRTRPGLALRATGESVSMAAAAGVPVRLVRLSVTVMGGALAGLAGGSLVLGQVGSFAERMTAGRGYVAIAIVVLGRWHPVGAALAALVFGVATALQFVFQASNSSVPYQLLLVLPYLITLLALGGAAGRGRAPADLGRDSTG
ncbi:MAG TPA: ABC transporter permease [Gemmatimonadales bacterium]|nr:ABC transporter permease [Gemmatimonadales bacterium]